MQHEHLSSARWRLGTGIQIKLFDDAVSILLKKSIYGNESLYVHALPKPK